MANETFPTNGTNTQPTYVDPKTNFVYTVDPATGQTVWVIDPTTGQPLQAPQQAPAVETVVQTPVAATANQPEQWSSSTLAATQQPQQTAAATTAAASPLNADQPFTQAPAATSTSGSAIASLILGILAILTSFLPIINNGSFFLALIGLILAIVGFVGIRKGKKLGKGLAIAGIILNILSIVIVLATQSMYGAAIIDISEELESGSKPVASEAPNANPASSEGTETQETPSQDNATSQASDADYSNMALGEKVTLENGMSVSVDNVERGLSNYNGEPVTGITVTYTNNGDSNESFNPFDWKALDSNGVLDNQAFFTEGENELSSGELAPGGSVSGNIYFDGDITKAYYYSNGLFQAESDIAWNLS